MRLVTGGDGSEGNIVVHHLADVREVSDVHLETRGWTMDLDWTPDSSRIVCSCQNGTLIQSADGSGDLDILADGSNLCRISRGGDRVCLILSEGVGYSCGARSGAILDISGEGSGGNVRTQVQLQDSLGTLEHTRYRVCRWALDDQLLLVATAASSAFGCPILSAYRSSDGACVARFCSPYPHNFSHIDVCEGAQGVGEVLIAVSDDQGKVFLLSLVGF
jgi:hypothetical protein